MACLITNPAFHHFFARLGLREAADFLGLPGIIVSGHSDRNVARVHLECGREKLTAFLKREHRVLRRQRLVNMFKGFGYLSNSMREAATLKALEEKGIGCPSVLAAGEDERGRAFLLIQELIGFVELRTFLNDEQTDTQTRRRFARRLGERLAEMHDAGFDHPDLYSKHVLVQPDTLEIRILDWQRSRRHRRLNECKRWRNLAALNATVADELATNLDRRIVFRAYLRRAQLSLHAQEIGAMSRTITRHTDDLRRRRPRLEELRRADAVREPQQLIWLDGEALCVTPDFYTGLKGNIPSWLSKWSCSARYEQRVVNVDGSPAELVSRCEHQPMKHLWCRLRGTRPAAPETRQAGLIFRLQRFGVSTPRLLAFGQRQTSRGRAISFLLTQPGIPGAALSSWLNRDRQINLWTAERKERWQVIRATAKTIRQLHDAGFGLVKPATSADLLFSAFRNSQNEIIVGLNHVRALREFRASSRRRAMRELLALQDLAKECGLSRSDMLRFLVSYFGPDWVEDNVRSMMTDFRRRWAMRRLARGSRMRR